MYRAGVRPLGTWVLGLGFLFCPTVIVSMESKIPRSLDCASSLRIPEATNIQVAVLSLLRPDGYISSTDLQRLLNERFRYNVARNSFFEFMQRLGPGKENEGKGWIDFTYVPEDELRPRRRGGRELQYRLTERGASELEHFRIWSQFVSQP